MIKKIISVILLTLSVNVFATPFVVSDPYSITSQIQPSHCGIKLDSGVKIEVPVTSDATGKFCKFDVGNVIAGSHTVTATFILKDSLWGNLESAPSPPFTFVRPDTPVSPNIPGLIK